MSVQDFVRSVFRDISSACEESNVLAPESVQFEIKLNASGEVCLDTDGACSKVVFMAIRNPLRKSDLGIDSAVKQLLRQPPQ